MTPRQVAARLGYRSVASVRNLISTGVLRASCQEVASGQAFYDVSEADLEKFEATYKPLQRGKPRGKPAS